MQERLAMLALGFLTLGLTSWTWAQTQTPAAPPAQSRAQLFVAWYERGSAWDETKGALQQTGIQDHGQFLRANLDKLVGAAPFVQGVAAGSSDRVVGMVILTAASQADAEAFIQTDPAVSTKLMKATVRRWMADRVRAY